MAEPVEALGSSVAELAEVEQKERPPALLCHSARQSRNPGAPDLNRSAIIFWMLRLRVA